MMKVMKDRAQLRLTIIVAAAVIVCILAFLSRILSKTTDGGSAITIIAVAALVAVVPILMVFRKWKDLREGYPSTDDRGRRKKQMAGYYAFLTTINVVLGFMYYDLVAVPVLDAPAPDGTLYCVLIDVAALIAFGGYWLWFSRRGESTEGV
jgi:hypothetical protein